jgi:uncharacterized NAD(P)/FAD-binding protein YdhS
MKFDVKPAVSLPDTQARIAIVGGGFSGVLALANIVALAETPLAVDLFEEKAAIGLGVAYGTKEPVHLLNVRADRMGAFSGMPGGFYDWAKNFAIAPESFAPRMVYGEYIAHILQEALALAKQKGIAVSLHSNSPIDEVRAGSKLTLVTKNKEIAADALILATGNQTPRAFDFEKTLAADNPHYVKDMWQAGALSALPAGGSIVVIGTGLTAIDAVQTIAKSRFQGKVTLISRNGLLPAAHAYSEPYPAWEWTTNPQRAPKTAFGLLVRLRREVENAAMMGHDWRAVVDSLRPVTQTLWRNLDTKEKQRFLRRLFTFWNIHRHRMAPEIADHMAALQKKGMLQIINAGIVDVVVEKNALEIFYRQRQGNTQSLKADLLINCTGPDYSLKNTPNPLLRSLIAQELAALHPLGMGLSEEKRHPALFMIGTLLLGERLETVAVPELRDQAFSVAKSALEYINTEASLMKKHP